MGVETVCTSGMETLDFSPTAVLESDLLSAERMIRLRGIRWLKRLAVAIGPERASRELMVVMAAHVLREDDDEVLFEMAGIFGADFIKFLGGVRHAAMLLQPLHDLACVEETIVHVRATDSISEVLDTLAIEPGCSTPDLASDILKKLVSRDDAACGLGSKLSAASLIPAVLRTLFHCENGGEARAKARKVLETFSKLASDDAPSVRRAVARQISAVACWIDSDMFAEDLAHNVWALVNDELDDVRAAALESLGTVLGNISQKDTAIAWTNATSELIAQDSHAGVVVRSLRMRTSTYEDASADSPALHYPFSSECFAGEVQSDASSSLRDTDRSSSDPVLRILVSVSSDPSWRLRQCLARGFDGFFRHFCNNHSGGDACENACLLTVYAQLFFDRENEVRAAAYGSLPRVAAVNPLAFAQHHRILAASCHGLDSCETLKVRVAAARAIMSLMAVLNAPSTDSKYHVKPSTAGIQDSHPQPSVAPLNGCHLESIDPNAQRYLFKAVETKLLALVHHRAGGVEDANHVDVLLATLDGLKDAVPYLTLDCVARVSALIESINHENWRIRRALNCALPAVAARQGRAYFESQLLEAFVRSFQDRICEVRASAVEALGRLRDLKPNSDEPSEQACVHVFDSDWLMDKIGKRLAEMYLTMSYYVYRITIVQAFETLAQKHLAEKHMESIVLFLSEAARDDVANVRLAAVSALGVAAAYAEDRVIVNLVKPVVNELVCKDSDTDVRAMLKQVASGL